MAITLCPRPLAVLTYTSLSLWVAVKKIYCKAHQNNADVIRPGFLEFFHFDLVVKKERGGGAQDLEFKIRQHEQFHPEKLLATVAASTETVKE